MNTRLTYRFRFLAVPLIGLFFNFVTYFTTPPNLIEAGRAEYGWLMNDVVGAIITIIDSLVLSEGCLLIYHWLDKKIPWERNAAKRFWVQFAAHTIYALAATVSVYFFFGSCVLATLGKSWTLVLKDIQDYEFLFYQTLFDATIISLLIVAVYTGLMLFERWQQATLEAEALKRAQLLAHVAALQAQLDPHFLFNNLNTLTTLIEDEPRQAVHFVEELSEVYRYVLQVRERETVTLAEELVFLRAYVFLATMRFGDNLQITIDIPHSLHETLLPPMALQMLVENAMKHNIISREKPLNIAISTEHNAAHNTDHSAAHSTDHSTDQEWVVVRNSLQLRTSREHSTGIGLKNLFDRYAMLTNIQPSIPQQTASGMISEAVSESPSAFVVKLPLLSTHKMSAQKMSVQKIVSGKTYANGNH